MGVSKKQYFVLSAAFVCTIAGYFLFDSFLSKRKVNFHEQFYTQGYSFRNAQENDDDFARYKIGESFDLTKLRMTSGSELLSLSIDRLILLSVVNPDCIYCKLSQDIIDALKADVVDSNVDYFPVIFTPVSDETDLTEYAKSIGFSDVLTWEKTTRPPNLLISMPTPAHILLDRKGIILQVWFNSSRDADVRKRMEKQIVSDVRLINDTYGVVAKESQPR